MAHRTTSLWRGLKAYQVYGANTNVGKTIMSTILCKAFARYYPEETNSYLKPVSTGPQDEADDRHLRRFSRETKTQCLFQFDEAVSPHIAARATPLSDSEILEQVLNHLSASAQAGPGTLLLETAGGVHSPTPSGSSQADLYRPLRLPVCLVADHKLGGISASISAFESLHVRGYDLDLVMQFEDGKYQNHSYLKNYFEKKAISTLSLPPPPSRNETEDADFEAMSEYYEAMSRLGSVEEIVAELSEKHTKRIETLEGMPTRAYNSIWYPFTQHRDISPETIMAIDSASGDFFETHAMAKSNTKAEPKNVLAPTFDGSASWWTQGLGHGSPELALSAAYAAGRYGHVMFAGTIHEPALKLAETLLQSMQNPRLAKCFYSDNGSTGIEVATKMALTAASERYNWKASKGNIGVIGLKGSYHGDTIGAMDCSEPSTFNEKVHWYEGKGFWFDFPQVKVKKGMWVVESPEGMEDKFGANRSFSSLDDMFDIKTRFESPEGQIYRAYIERTLERLVNEEGRKFGALIMEPVILGAGGMLFADPLFQHCLVQVIRNNAHLFGEYAPSSSGDTHAWAGLPVIFDEVFTGLYRLGRFSSASFLQVHPDISVNAKLLTGGLIPLCTTLASHSVFDAFMGPEKKEALLHGHSYTAHPIGCHVANTSLKTMRDMDLSGHWEQYQHDWRIYIPKVEIVRDSKNTGPVPHVWSMWSKDFVLSISHKETVESVIALGSVLAISLQDQNAGYNSLAATGLQRKLSGSSKNFKIHARVLGNVVYVMGSMTSKPETLRAIEMLLSDVIS